MSATLCAPRAVELNHPAFDDALLAEKFQLEFYHENQILAAERARLVSIAPTTFTCGVCFDEQPEDYVALIEGCQHRLCRDCLREYIRSKLQERRYPILCPLCTADATREDVGGTYAYTGVNDTNEFHNIIAVISDGIIRDIGVSEEEYDVFEQLQLVSFSVLLHCRQ